MNKEFFVHESSYVDENISIGQGTRIWHFCHIMNDSVIGKNCNIGQNVVISSGVEIGDNCKIQNNVSLYTGVKCEDNVFLGPSCVFTNVINPRSEVNRRSEYQLTIVEKGVSVGANATIVCGITLGHHSFVGAGAVVTKNTQPYSLVVGNPARQVGWMSERGTRLSFDRAGKAVCEESGEKYELINESVKKV